MSAVLPRRMTVSEFLAWAETRSEGRFELVDGHIVAMAPERLGHVRAKTAVWLALSEAIKRAGLPCEAFGDGATVRIDEHNAREPDASVQCGGDIDPGAMVLELPLIVAEVLSPSSERDDR